MLSHDKPCYMATKHGLISSDNLARLSLPLAAMDVTRSSPMNTDVSESYRAAMCVYESYILGVDNRWCLQADAPGIYCLSPTPHDLCGKVIKPIRCNSRFARYFMIDSGHVIHLVGAGVMAKEQGTIWVAEHVVQTAGLSRKDVDDFIEKERDKFMVTPLFVCEVPKSIAVYWDLLTDSQRERAKDDISRAALHKMLYRDRRISDSDSDDDDDAMSKLEDDVGALELKDSFHFDDVIMELQLAVFKAGRQHAVDAVELEAVVKALEENVSNLKFEFDVKGTDISLFSRVLETMLDDLRHEDNVKGRVKDKLVMRWWR